LSDDAARRRELAEAFRFQGRSCAAIGSAIYAELLGRAADDLERGGVLAEVAADYPGHPVLDAMPLRLLGAVHRLVLAGCAPDLAAFYPSAGGRFEAEGAWRALLEVAASHRDEIRGRLAANVQTNEVRRSAALLPGLLRVARASGLPLRVREIGSSAGLNLLFDRFRYELGPHRWGDAKAAVVVRAAWEGPGPDLGARLRVASRAGCDVDPVDVRSADERLRLESFVWPDQLERLEVLRGALTLAQDEPPPLERAPAGAWLARELAEPARGEAVVVLQSVMWWYLPEAERAQVEAVVRAAGAAARSEAPVAWLRLEGARKEEAELRLLLWPGGEDRLLATAHWHGARVRWIG
jgi:hypothetical protein